MDGNDGELEYQFSAIIGVYLSLQRADEVAASAAQVLREAGASDSDYRFSVKVTTYYDE